MDWIASFNPYLIYKSGIYWLILASRYQIEWLHSWLVYFFEKSGMLVYFLEKNLVCRYIFKEGIGIAYAILCTLGGGKPEERFIQAWVLVEHDMLLG